MRRVKGAEFMWRTAKIFLLLIVVAFIAGLSPTIMGFINECIVKSKEGFSLHPHVVSVITGLIYTAKSYAWHLTIAYACIVGAIIFMESQNPDRTILWLITLVFLPVFGVILYMVIGPDMSGFRKRKLFRLEKGKIDRTPFTYDKRFLIGRMLHSSSGADLTAHNKLDILVDGDETFGALKEELRLAEHYIHIQYFIIKDDEIGREIRDLLTDAARRGVKIRVLYDAVGSWSLKMSYFKELLELGAECHAFMPVALPLFRRQMNYRNHRKIVVIDDRVAFTGGLNIGDEYLGRGHLGHWRDTHVRVKGGAVADLHKIFLHDWCMRTGESPKDICADISCHDCGNVEKPDFSSLPKLPMQVVASGIDTAWHAIAQGYYGMISRAKERVWITSPYVVPGANIMNALITASMSGVDVRLIMPSSRDHFLVFWGSRGNIEPLLRAGVRVFMYKKGFVHAKTALADDDICSVGTCNLDVRSLEINFENQLFIYDAATTEKFARQFETDIADSCEVKLDEWQRRPLWQKILESFGRLYSAQI
mgnify:CR=1 FL=1